MYSVEVQTPPPAGPVTAAQLRARLRLNDSAEDDDLTELLAAAVDLFESDTNHPVLATVYRQYLSRWPYHDWWHQPGVGVVGSPPHVLVEGLHPDHPGRIVLGRGGLTAIAGVYRFLADGSTEALTGWVADVQTPPARVQLAARPDQVVTAAGVPVSPVGYVEYTAGWDASHVPPLVITAIKLLAAHWYSNREAYLEKSLAELPAGWCRVTTKYRLGLSGDWGQ
ncbi:MAG TPA: hypothetical protein VH092_11675 [Urbifossiella sp.]|nr:hypothetical protein [Urbifossiella sp.]